MTLRGLVYTGSAVPPAKLQFGPGSNLLWGASNTGKSFTAKSIDFMLGGHTPLPDYEERLGYSTIWLSFSLAAVGDFTVSRSVKGGSYQLWPGLVTSAPAGITPRALAAEHSAASDDNLSAFLLSRLGFGGRL